MNNVSLHDRIWGSFAHVPIITIIWVSYLTFRVWPDVSIKALLLSAKSFETSSLPILPLLFTCASIPILMTIRYLQKRRTFVKQNAAQAYGFNWWLLKSYFVLFVVMLFGYVISSEILMNIVGSIGVFLSVLCLIQSVAGVYYALRGELYHYWLPLPALAACYALLRDCCKAAGKK
ncbi:hypothetical protein FJ365_05870 [Candidatus Dependentiae bacterium]|nr:hypothetical protein [Candidatus Dependentiae bacterium]